MKTILNRRLLLQSATASIALPRLEGMLNGNGTAYAAGGPLPKRFGVFFWGLGMNPERWTPQKTGPGFTLSEHLKPFEPVREYLSVATGFNCAPIMGQVHVGAQVGILTGDGTDTQPLTTATVRKPSVDQLVAAFLGNGSKFKSIEVRSSGKNAGPRDGGTAIDWCSHNGPSSPNKSEVNPRVVFARLFGAGSTGPAMSDVERQNTNFARKSVLDLVRQDISRLNMRLGTADRLRMQQHLDGIRAIELQLQEMPTVACKAPAMPADFGTKPEDFGGGQIRARHKVMSEMLAIAFACDLTRVATLQFSHAGSHERFPDSGFAGECHETGHKLGITPDIDKAILFWMESFSVWLQAMKNLPEGAGNVLDNACIFGTSDHSYAPSHRVDEFPLLVAGKAQGRLKGGVHVRLVNEIATRVPFTLMKALGMPLTSWGEQSLKATAVVSELLV